MDTTPSFVLGYWRPWQKDTSFVDSYCNYLKDTSLVRFGAGLIKNYLAEQNEIIQNAAADLGMSLNNIEETLTKQLEPLNRNMDVMVQQQRLSNLLLKDIVELLKIPDSEKERQMKISLGIKFFIKAQKDPELFDESLKCFLEAEQILPLDHFVLHRIGYIYLYSPQNVNVEKAIDYFLRAAKLAIVEDDEDTMKLASILALDADSEYHRSTHDTNAIHALAADSLNKAAYGSYILGRDQDALKLQRKATSYSGSGKDFFCLAKYEARVNEIEQCCSDLKKAIDLTPSTAQAALLDYDLAAHNEIISIIEDEASKVETDFNRLVSNEANDFIRQNLEWAKVNLSFSEKKELIKKKFD